MLPRSPALIVESSIAINEDLYLYIIVDAIVELCVCNLLRDRIAI